MPSPLTYQDYVNYMQQFAGSEGGQNPAVDQGTWGQMDPAAQWREMGGGLTIGRNDPRYQELNNLAGGVQNNRPVQVTGGNFDNRNWMGTDAFTDPSQVYKGDGYSISNQENQTPDTQSGESAGGMTDAQWAMAMASLFAGGAFAGGAFGGAAAGAGAGADLSLLPALEPTTVGGLGPAFEYGAAGAGAGAGVGGGGGAGGGSLGGMYGGADLSAMAPIESTTVGNLGPGFSGANTPWQNVMAGNYGDAASQVGRSVMNNPMRALQTAQLLGSAAGGLAGDKGSGSSGGGSSPQLGSMGWKLPQAGPYKPTLYDPALGSKYSGWLEQYLASLQPLKGMYGKR